MTITKLTINTTDNNNNMSGNKTPTGQTDNTRPNIRPKQADQTERLRGLCRIYNAVHIYSFMVKNIKTVRKNH